MDNTVYKALVKYFKTLFYNGSYKLSDLKKLIVLLFIYRYFYNSCRKITTEQLNIINSALLCLYGQSCFISFPDYMLRIKLGCK